MEHNENRGKTLNSSEYFTNSQAHGSNDRAFSGTDMQRHHQDIQDSKLFSTSTDLYIYFREFQYYNL